MKRNKGITLIALVITIIVLLILAGVAISMLSGENGILRKAAEAKTKTEDASFAEQVRIATMSAMTNKDGNLEEGILKDELKKLGIEEKDILKDGEEGYVVSRGANRINITKNGNVVNLENLSDIDIELTEYFKQKSLPFKCTYGYITGFKLDEDSDDYISKYNVKELEESLPEGYKVVSRYEYDGSTYTGKDVVIEESEKSNTKIETGMTVQKDGQEVARTIVFGDVDCNGKIDTDDGLEIFCYIEYNDPKYIPQLTDFQKTAANFVYNDENLNFDDGCMINLFWAGAPEDKLYDELYDQNYIVKTRGNNLKRNCKELPKYISQVDRNKGCSFEYDSETDTYKLTVNTTKIKTVKNLIDALPESDKVKIIKKGETNFEDVSADEDIVNGYYFTKIFEYDYSKYNQGIQKSNPRIVIEVE